MVCCKPIASGFTRTEILPTMSQDDFIFQWSSCTVQALLKSEEVGVSQLFLQLANVHMAFMLVAETARLVPALLADAWAVFSFTSTLRTCESEEKFSLDEENLP